MSDQNTVTLKSARICKIVPLSWWAYRRMKALLLESIGRQIVEIIGQLLAGSFEGGGELAAQHVADEIKTGDFNSVGRKILAKNLGEERVADLSRKVIEFLGSGIDGLTEELVYSTIELQKSGEWEKILPNANNLTCAEMMELRQLVMERGELIELIEAEKNFLAVTIQTVTGKMLTRGAAEQS